MHIYDISLKNIIKIVVRTPLQKYQTIIKLMLNIIRTLKYDGNDSKYDTNPWRNLQNFTQIL